MQHTRSILFLFAFVCAISHRTVVAAAISTSAVAPAATLEKRCLMRCTATSPDYRINYTYTAALTMSSFEVTQAPADFTSPYDQILLARSIEKIIDQEVANKKIKETDDIKQDQENIQRIMSAALKQLRAFKFPQYEPVVPDYFSDTFIIGDYAVAEYTGKFINKNRVTITYCVRKNRPEESLNEIECEELTQWINMRLYFREKFPVDVFLRNKAIVDALFWKQTIIDIIEEEISDYIRLKMANEQKKEVAKLHVLRAAAKLAEQEHTQVLEELTHTPLKFWSADTREKHGFLITYMNVKIIINSSFEPFAYQIKNAPKIIDIDKLHALFNVHASQFTGEIVFDEWCGRIGKFLREPTILIPTASSSSSSSASASSSSSSSSSSAPKKEVPLNANFNFGFF